MFKDKSTNATDKIGNSATLINAGTVLHGDVKSDNDLRIDGTINGNVNSSAKIVVGPTGYVKGNINGKQADITGKVHGNISVQEVVQLRGESNVQGNLAAATLQIDPTAIFNGQCKMGVQEIKGSVVHMTEMDVAAKAK